jgi:pimeloyl-ACP methyl ester carboxylesterase
MKHSARSHVWTALVLAGAALVALGAGCGGAPGSSTSPSPSGSTSSAGASPPASVVQVAPVQHVKVGDLSVGFRVIGPLARAAGVSATPGGSAAAGASAAAGDQTPLLLIMGSSGTMDEWSPAFVTALAQDRQVVVFDNRGIGETDDPMGAYPFSQLADDTAGLIKALGYDRADVLGWSMGGDVAIDLAVRHPAVVEQLVSYAGDPGGRRAMPPAPKALAVLMDTSGSAQKRGERLIALLFPKAYRDANPAYAAAFPIPTEQAKPAAIDLQNKAIGEWTGVWGGLKGITCPTLFVTGAEDELTPPRNAVMMSACVPGSWLERFAGAGHGLMYQDPQGLAQAVLTFLSVTASAAAGG